MNKNSGRCCGEPPSVLPKALALSQSELGFFHVNYHSRTPIVSGYRGGFTSAGTISADLSAVQVGALGAAGIPTVARGVTGCAAFDVPTFGALHALASIGGLAGVTGSLASATSLSALNATNAACAANVGRGDPGFRMPTSHARAVPRTRTTGCGCA